MILLRVVGAPARRLRYPGISRASRIPCGPLLLLFRYHDNLLLVLRVRNDLGIRLSVLPAVPAVPAVPTIPTIPTIPAVPAAGTQHPRHVLRCCAQRPIAHARLGRKDVPETQQISGRCLGRLPGRRQHRADSTRHVFHDLQQLRGLRRLRRLRRVGRSCLVSHWRQDPQLVIVLFARLLLLPHPTRGLRTPTDTRVASTVLVLIRNVVYLWIRLSKLRIEGGQVGIGLGVCILRTCPVVLVAPRQPVHEPALRQRPYHGHVRETTRIPGFFAALHVVEQHAVHRLEKRHDHDSLQAADGIREVPVQPAGKLRPGTNDRRRQRMLVVLRGERLGEGLGPSGDLAEFVVPVVIFVFRRRLMLCELFHEPV